MSMVGIGLAPPELNPTYNQPPLPETTPDGMAEASIRTDVGWVGPNQTFHIIVPIKPVEGWHIYWKNPGASGSPTEFEVNGPSGFNIGDPIYPRPMGIYSEEGATYGYKDVAAFFIPVTAPEELSDGEVTFHAEAFWLACRGSCVRGSQKLSIAVSTKADGAGPEHKDMTLKRFQSALPKPLSTLEGASVNFSGNALHIAGNTTLEPIQFVGDTVSGVRFYSDHSELKRNQQEFHLSVPVNIDFDNAGQDVVDIEGLLLFGRKQTDPAYVVKKRVRQSELKMQ